MIGIYKITSPTGKVYIGQSWNIHKRFIQYKNLHCADQPRLYNSLKKHGALCHSFDVVHELPPDIHQNLMDGYEHLYMDLYRASGIDMLNLREAGSNGKLSEETKKKISSANKGRPGVNKGCKLKPETIIKLKEARKKQVFSDKDKRKISDSLKKHFKLYPQIGKPHTTASKLKISLNNKGKKFPEHLKQRYSAERSGEKNQYYGKKHSVEVRLKMSEKSKGKRVGANNGRARAVLQYSLDNIFIKEYETIKMASIELGISRQSINCAAIGRTKTAHKFIWKYKNDLKW